MVAMTALMTVNLTFGFFEFYTVLKRQFVDERTFFGYFAAVVNFYDFYLIGMVMGTGSLTMKQGKRTENVLHQGIFKGFRKNQGKVMQRKQIFLMQMQHFNAKTTAGLFVLEWKVLMMVSES